MKPVIIGTCPSTVCDYELEPCSGRFGKRVAELSGKFQKANLEPDIKWFLDNYIRVNLVPTRPFNIDYARISACSLKWVLRDSIVMMAGREVESYFFKNSYEFFEWIVPVDGYGAWVTIPHPLAGVWWNSSENSEKARMFFEDIAEKIIKDNEDDQHVIVDPEPKRMEPWRFTSKQ